MIARFALLSLFAAVPGCGLFSGGDGGSGADLQLLPPDLSTSELMPDFAGAAPGSDLTFTGYRMDVVVLLVEDEQFFHPVNCDDPRAQISSIAITAVDNGNGAKAVTTVGCPAGKSGLNAVIELPTNSGPFTVTAVTNGRAVGRSQAQMVSYGQSPSLRVVLFPPDMM